MLKPEEIEKRRKIFLQKGFELFSGKSIEAVTLKEVADASGYGVATLYRYFTSKPRFLVEISAWKWGEFFQNNRKRRSAGAFEQMTAAEMFDHYLNTFLEVYRNHRPLLRFNQFFNVYIQSEPIEKNEMKEYLGLLKPVTDFFHIMYQKALKDRTLNTDISEEELLSVTLHLMLAVVTRYAVGLAFKSKDFDADKELEMQKEMVFKRFAG